MLTETASLLISVTVPPSTRMVAVLVAGSAANAGAGRAATRTASDKTGSRVRVIGFPVGRRGKDGKPVMTTFAITKDTKITTADRKPGTVADVQTGFQVTIVAKGDVADQITVMKPAGK